MSVAFVQSQHKKGPAPNQATIQKMLDENNQLIQAIVDYQNKGRASECMQYQQMLHRNLVYLATLADSNQNVQALLPAPGQYNQAAQGGMSQQQNAPMNQMRPPNSMANQMPPNTMISWPSQSQGSIGNASYNMQQQGNFQNQQQPMMSQQQQQPMMSQQQPMMSQQQPMMSQQQPMMSQQQPMMSQQQPMMSQSQQMMTGPATSQNGQMMSPRQMQMQGGYRRPQGQVYLVC
ncbi:hypothetical protein KUTeg_018804 [Tegillarca granosa]|uniref:SS18 N-terminal domain-containing protein n=1 Tax=Tegillarca granosa TaxID=220873 RepID=A0ABQ9EAQ3_TEGGR|nr:hypothetical protein KUTeg_018804 [Tegillarca granosa]